MAINKKAEELWITNISKQSISIGDLCIRIKAGQSINLLGKTKKGKLRYNISTVQIEDSLKSGSIYKKGNYVKVRKVPPVLFNTQIDVANHIDKSLTRISRQPTHIEVQEYPDLDYALDDMTEEEYAAENADVELMDKAPILSQDPKYDN